VRSSYSAPWGSGGANRVVWMAYRPMGSHSDETADQRKVRFTSDSRPPQLEPVRPECATS